jgi:GTPase
MGFHMSPPESVPTVVIVGRPNVGKSTLFNVITGERRAIVGDEPGITRDRLHSTATYAGRTFELIDTGGIIMNDDEFLPGEILRQARVALERASHIIFLVDGRSEISAADRDLGRMLRALGKPLTLVVNKIDNVARESLLADFYSLGIPEVMPVSSEHRLGISDLLDRVVSTFDAGTAPEEPVKESAPARIRVAIIGRPNVGKSTLLNALVGEERAIVSPVAGTTRDAVNESVVVGGTEYVFVDTAGIRRKGKTHLLAEKLSVVMARKHLEAADVVLLVLDASEGIVALDATIGGYAHEAGRCVVVCVNKWDVITEGGRRRFERAVRDELKFLDYAPVAFLSAKEGTGVRRLLGVVQQCWHSASRRVTTGELNRFIERLSFDRRQKIRYVTQAGVRPPTFVLFTNKGEKLHFSTERYLVNQLREAFGFEGTPIVIRTRHSSRSASRGKRSS